jgi:branched-chain amino acid transport system permease protein
MSAVSNRRVEGVPLPLVLVGIAALIAFPLIFTSPTPQHILILTLLFGAMGTAWNILGGYAGQISIGHGVYFGIGAYTVGFFYANFLVSPWLTWPLALILSVTAAIVIGLPTFRLRGHYFILASVFIVDAIFIVVSNWEGVGAAIGIEYPIYREGDLAGSLWTLQYHDSKLPYYYSALGLFVASVFVSWRIQFMPLSYYLRAIREDQEAAQSLGIDVTRYKLVALVISALITTLCGIFYAQYVLYIEPAATISIIISLEIAFIAILGGIGTLWGPVLGAFIIVPLTEILRQKFSGAIAPGFGSGDASLLIQLEYFLEGGGGNLDILAYGLIVMLIARFQPNGVLGFLRRLD